jgi:hypothetical protein
MTVFDSDFFTVDEECLKESVYGEPNYKFIFRNDSILRRLSENYKTYGAQILDENITESFLNHEKAASIEMKRVFEELRDVFSITKPKKTQIPASPERLETSPDRKGKSRSGNRRSSQIQVSPEKVEEIRRSSNLSLVTVEDTKVTNEVLLPMPEEEKIIERKPNRRTSQVNVSPEKVDERRRGSNLSVLTTEGNKEKDDDLLPLPEEEKPIPTKKLNRRTSQIKVSPEKIEEKRRGSKISNLTEENKDNNENLLPLPEEEKITQIEKIPAAGN